MAHVASRHTHVAAQARPGHRVHHGTRIPAQATPGVHAPPADPLQTSGGTKLGQLRTPPTAQAVPGHRRRGRGLEACIIAGGARGWQWAACPYRHRYYKSTGAWTPIAPQHAKHP